MEKFNRQKHWETIYQTKPLNQVSWYQPVPETSIAFIDKLNLDKNAKIIDVGGGDSFFVDYLLAQGFQNITVLDISQAAIDRAQLRLGQQSHKVKWKVIDVLEFHSTEKYDVWHDRAAFHFLTDEQEISQYIDIVREHIAPLGVLLIGTFSEQGPQKCSGIEIKQYSEKSMSNRFHPFFDCITCHLVDHKTPFDTLQNFVFCSFRLHSK